jgi:hypothetical protein
VRRPELSAKVEQHLRDHAELHVSARVQRGRLTLEGRVSSAEARQAAEDLAAGVAVGHRIHNHLEIEDLRLDQGRHMRIAAADDLKAVEQATGKRAPSERQPGEATVTYGARDSGTGESGEPFILPMDPALELDPRGNPRILGGFGLSSLDDVAVQESASDQALGDDASASKSGRKTRIVSCLLECETLDEKSIREVTGCIDW